jgi:hypothetical protein
VHRQPRLLPRKAEPDRHIDVIPVEIHQAKAGGEPQFDIGMGAGESEKPGGEPFRGEGGTRRHRQGRAVAGAFRGAPRGGQRHEAVRHARRQRAARIGQFNRAVHAVKHGRAQMLLEVLDLEGQRGGRDVQFRRRLGKAHVPCGGVEGAKRGEGRQAIAHVHSSNT